MVPTIQKEIDAFVDGPLIEFASRRIHYFMMAYQIISTNSQNMVSKSVVIIYLLNFIKIS